MKSYDKTSSIAPMKRRRHPHPPPPPPSPLHKGVAYLPTSSGVDPAIMANVNVDIGMIGVKCRDIEPSPGTYVFNSAISGQSFDTQLATIEAAGKPARMLVQTDYTAFPAWLITMINADPYPYKFFQFKNPAGATVTIVVFWQPTYLARKLLVSQALNAHVAGHPLVKSTQVSFVQATNNDWNAGSVSPTPDGLFDTYGGDNPQQRWLNTLIGTSYATWGDACIDAGLQTFQLSRTAFPDKLLVFPIGRVVSAVLNPAGGTFGANISHDVVIAAQAAAPGYIVAEKQNLTGGLTPPAPGYLPNGDPSAWTDLWILSQAGVLTAAQMLWNAYGENLGCADNWMCKLMNGGNTASACADSSQMLYNAVTNGKTYQMLWQEIYHQDITNLDATNADPHLPGGVPRDVMNYAHTLLTAP